MVEDKHLKAAIAELRAAGCLEAAALIEETSGESREIAVHCIHAVVEKFKPKSPDQTRSQEQARRALARVARELDIKLEAPPAQPATPVRRTS